MSLTVAEAYAVTTEAAAMQEAIGCKYKVQGNEKSQLKTSKTKNEVPVGVALEAIIAGITCYQTYAAGAKVLQKATPGDTEDQTLLSLSKAVIDLKTVATTGVNGNISGFAILVQGAHTSTKTTDFNYAYAVPTKKDEAQPGKNPGSISLMEEEAKTKPKPPRFEDQIANAMLLAADLAATSNIPGMKNTGFTVTLSVGVENKGSLGLTFSFLGMSAGAGGSIDKNTTQQVTLTFGNPSPTPKSKS